MFFFQYGESLLMVAIRAGQQEMAEFLVDNGIDYTYEAKLVVSLLQIFACPIHL